MILTPVGVKSGVRLDGLKAVMWRVVSDIAPIFASHGVSLVITSGLDGQHSAHSLHYKGLALDIRSRDIATDSEKRQIRNEIQEALGEEFDVVLEADHFHVEFDSKP